MRLQGASPNSHGNRVRGSCPAPHRAGELWLTGILGPRSGASDKFRTFLSSALPLHLKSDLERTQAGFHRQGESLQVPEHSACLLSSFQEDRRDGGGRTRQG